MAAKFRIDDYGAFDGDKSGAHFRGSKIACIQCEDCEYYFYDKKSNLPYCCSHRTITESIAGQKSEGSVRDSECKVYEPKKEKGSSEKAGKKKGNLCWRIFCCLCKCFCKQAGKWA